MARTRVRRRRIAVLLAGAVVVALWTGPVANAIDGPDRTGAATGPGYVVRPSDTLWSIARRVAPERDPRSVVDAIAAANGVRGDALVPGQTLSIPA